MTAERPAAAPEEPRARSVEEATEGSRRWRTVLVVAVAVVVISTFVVLHLTGVLGPSAH